MRQTGILGSRWAARRLDAVHHCNRKALLLLSAGGRNLDPGASLRYTEQRCSNHLPVETCNQRLITQTYMTRKALRKNEVITMGRQLHLLPLNAKYRRKLAWNVIVRAKEVVLPSLKLQHKRHHRSYIQAESENFKSWCDLNHWQGNYADLTSSSMRNGTFSGLPGVNTCSL